MKICWSLSGMFKRVNTHYSFDIPEFKSELIGKDIYLPGQGVVGHITDVFPESDLVYGEIPDGEYSKHILDSKGLNMCSFEIVKETKV